MQFAINLRDSKIFPEIQEVIKIIRDCVSNQTRFPTAPDLMEALFAKGLRGSKAGEALRILTMAGTIEIFVSGQNYRVVKIGNDETLGDPTGGMVYRKLDKYGDHWLTRQGPTGG